MHHERRTWRTQNDTNFDLKRDTGSKLFKNKKGNFKNYHFLGLVDDQIYRVWKNRIVRFAILKHPISIVSG
jgi:hypothetical protein